MQRDSHHFVYGDIQPEYFMFNNPESACPTCGGLGVQKLTHPELLVPDPRRSIRGGCFVREAFKYNPETWDGRVMYSLAKSLKFLARHSLGKTRRVGATGHSGRHSTARSRCPSPPDAKEARDDWEGKEIGFGGIARRIERRYRRYRQKGEANSGMEAWLDNVMVEHTCPDCNGARVRRHQAVLHYRRQDPFTISASSTSTSFMRSWEPSSPVGRGADAGRQVLKEIRARLELLLGIGLDYLNLNRRSGTLSGGESQRIRSVHADRVGADGNALRAR